MLRQWRKIKLIQAAPRWFTNLMSLKLRRNRRKCENIASREFWRQKLHEELDELIIEMYGECRPKEIAEEAADLANVAMLCANFFRS